MAGLACALTLEKNGVESTVFDTVCTFNHHMSMYLLLFVLSLYREEFGWWVLFHCAVLLELQMHSTSSTQLACLNWSFWSSC